MITTRVFISACIWQGVGFDPLLVKNEKGIWSFPSEAFDFLQDKNFVRQTLERGLHRHVRGTLNPIHFSRKGFAMRLSVAASMPSVIFTTVGGERCMRNPRAEQKVDIHITMPLHAEWSDLSEGLPQGIQTLTEVRNLAEPVTAIVQQILNDKEREWLQLPRHSFVSPIRPAFGKTALKLMNKGVGKHTAERVTRPQNEGYWPVSREVLQSVA
jgi:hypothetical protein